MGRETPALTFCATSSRVLESSPSFDVERSSDDREQSNSFPSHFVYIYVPGKSEGIVPPPSSPTHQRLFYLSHGCLILFPISRTMSLRSGGTVGSLENIRLQIVPRRCPS